MVLYCNILMPKIRGMCISIVRAQTHTVENICNNFVYNETYLYLPKPKVERPDSYNIQRQLTQSHTSTAKVSTRTPRRIPLRYPYLDEYRMQNSCRSSFIHLPSLIIDAMERSTSGEH